MPLPADHRPHPRVGVVTVSYGSGEALEQFLESLRTQHASDIPVAVVDNKPGPDGVQHLAERYRATYVPLPDNPGYGAGMNAGVHALANGASPQSPDEPPFDAYFFCNPDVVFIEPVIGGLAASLLHDQSAGSIGPRTLDDDGRVYPSARNLPSLGTGMGHAIFGTVWPSNPWSNAYKNAAEYDQRRPAGWLSGAAVMVRREVFEEIGGWDEDYFLHFEDIDLGYRIGLVHRTNVYDPAFTIRHSGGHSLKKHSAVAEQAMTASGIRFMSKRYHGFWRSPLRWVTVLGLRLRGMLKTRRLRNS